MLALMPPIVGWQRNQIAHPRNVTPTLISPLACNPATPGLPGPSLTYSRTQYNQASLTTNMSILGTEQRAQHRHEEIAGSLENQTAHTEFQAYAGDQRLLNKLSEYQARLSHETAEAGNHRAEVATTRAAFGRDLELQRRRVADQLTEEFEANFRVFEQTQQARLEITEEEMSSQK